MNGLKRRIELAERLQGPKGRLIVVRADGEAEVAHALALSAIERTPADTVIRLRRGASQMPHVIGLHDEGAMAFLDGIDGRSLSLIREAA